MGIGIKEIKNAYKSQLIKDGRYDKAIEIAAQDTYEPILNYDPIHAEQEPVLKEIGYNFLDIALDLTAINKEISKSGSNFSSLMSDTKIRLDAVKKQLQREEERINDLNMLCSNLTGFDDIISLSTNDFSGSFSTDDNGNILSSSSDIKTIPYSVDSIEGNGYEGNGFVYLNNNFLSSSITTSSRSAISDSNVITAYEYSRLTAEKTESISSAPLNFDKEEAECSVSISSDKQFNIITLSSDVPSLVVKDILTSSDGIDYSSCLNKKININNASAKYDSKVIYSPGAICFPIAHYAKIVFRSDGYTYDDIACESSDLYTKRIIKLLTAKRHVIRINDMEAKAGSFSMKTSLLSGELISTPFTGISIFSNEYVPDHFPDGVYITYALIINGIRYDVVPINSQRSGIKIIKTSDISVSDHSIKRIEEPIVSAVLSVTIKSPNIYETPFLSGIKVCLQNTDAEVLHV